MLFALNLRSCVSLSVRCINRVIRYSSSDCVKLTTASDFESFVLKEKMKFVENGERLGYVSSLNHLKAKIDSVTYSSFKDFQIEPQSVAEKRSKAIVNGRINITDQNSGFKNEDNTKAIWIRKLVFTHDFLNNHLLDLHSRAVLLSRKPRGSTTRKPRDNPWFNLLAFGVEFPWLNHLAYARGLTHSQFALWDIENIGMTYLPQIMVGLWAHARYDGDGPIDEFSGPQPRWSHRTTAYLFEDAIDVLNKCIAEMDAPHSSIGVWKNMKASKYAINSFGLKDGDSSVKDVLIAIRESNFRHLVFNHLLASLSDDEMQTLLAKNGPKIRELNFIL